MQTVTNGEKRLLEAIILIEHLIKTRKSTTKAGSRKLEVAKAMRDRELAIAARRRITKN